MWTRAREISESDCEAVESSNEVSMNLRELDRKTDNRAENRAVFQAATLPVTLSSSLKIHPIYTNSSQSRKTRKPLIMLKTLWSAGLKSGIRSPLLYPAELQARVADSQMPGS